MANWLVASRVAVGCSALFGFLQPVVPLLKEEEVVWPLTVEMTVVEVEDDEDEDELPLFHPSPLVLPLLLPWWPAGVLME